MAFGLRIWPATGNGRTMQAPKNASAACDETPAALRQPQAKFGSGAVPAGARRLLDLHQLWHGPPRWRSHLLFLALGRGYTRRNQAAQEREAYQENGGEIAIAVIMEG